MKHETNSIHATQNCFNLSTIKQTFAGCIAAQRTVATTTKQNTQNSATKQSCFESMQKRETLFCFALLLSSRATFSSIGELLTKLASKSALQSSASLKLLFFFELRANLIFATCCKPHFWRKSSFRSRPLIRPNSSKRERQLQIARQTRNRLAINKQSIELHLNANLFAANNKRAKFVWFVRAN